MTPFFTPETLHRKAILDHHLEGLSYSINKKEEFKDEWKQQLLKNHMVQAELRKIEPLFVNQQIKVTLLKGFALLGDTYNDWGARFASDVDVLVAEEDLFEVKTLLRENGYYEAFEKKWLGNNFKYIMIKKTPLVEVTLEIHTKLFWHVKNRDRPTSLSPTFASYSVLSKEEQLLHLCGHLAFQHTFIKLFWLFDIQYFLKKHGENINWDYFWIIAREDKLLNSCLICLWLANKDSSLPFAKLSPSKLVHYFLKKLISKSFLIAPRKHPVRYFLIKFFLKDNLLDNFRYLTSWKKAKND